MVESRDWGHLPTGEAVRLFRFGDGHGLEVEASDYGARLVAIRSPDRDGRSDHVLLGFDTLAGYLSPAMERARPYLGCTVGRYANRIAGAAFTIDGTRYPLVANEGANQLHGGAPGFDRAVWRTEVLAAGVRFSHVSPAGDQGFPGTLRVIADIVVVAPGEIALRYAAETDAPTHVSLTSHGYFNLAGRGARSIEDHRLAIAADHVLPIDKSAIPLPGPPLAVAGTPFDLRREVRVGEALAGDHPQLRVADGFDHNFVLTGGDGPAASLRDPASGRMLEIFTSEPGMQLYTGNGFDGSVVDDAGGPLVRRQALALETQHFPDSPNRPDYPTTLLRPGETLRSETRLRFGVSPGRPS
ncbi:galactose mutarotase [Sphingomonas sp. XMGL2]|uniref:Aldose 1-epimerase n=2 Tax=Sphingomonas quercus TaxID=2842451 RepID=A0ABS6BGD6_9SPHN|nr:galactose mutarotase [Sphingomonas quercus]